MIALFIPGNRIFAQKEDFYSGEVDFARVLAVTPDGTPARQENELKYSIENDSPVLSRNGYIINTIKGDLERAFKNDLLWRAPAFTGSGYRVMKTGMGTFCFVDFYLDTPDCFNARNNISYRVRYRWHSRGALFRYLTGSRLARDLPHRCEYQLKIYRNQWVNGANDCLESRFEFRNDSFPFKADNSAPSPPWPFELFIKPAITGKYRNYTPVTTFDYAAYLTKELNRKGSIKLAPVLVVVTVRRRVHLGIANEFGARAAELGLGSAANAEQAILITLDTSEVYQRDFLDVYEDSMALKKINSLTPRLIKRLKKSLKPKKVFTELEFEFERNIESAISHDIAVNLSISARNRLLAVKQAFLDDLRTVAGLVARSLHRIGLDAVPGQESKYRKASNIKARN